MDKELFTELKDKVTETAKTALKKSNELVEMTKVNLTIVDQQAKINAGYRELGKMVYDAHASGTMEIDDLPQKCQEIDELTEELDRMREKLAMLKNVKCCPVCKRENSTVSSFCSACGNPLDE